MLRSAACLTVLLSLSPVAADAQWASVGAMPRPTRSGDTLTFRNSQGIATVTAVAPDIVRVRFAPRVREGNGGQARQTLGRDHSYAVVGRDLGAPNTTVEIGAGRTRLRTSRLVVTIQHNPFRLSVADASGTVLDEDDAEQGIAFSNARTRVWKRLTDDDQIFGLGEKTGHLNKRGRQLGGYNVTMWNSDTFAYEADTDPIYASVPFYIVLRKGRAHGVFLDNTFRTNFDIGHTSPGLLAFGAEGGDLNYYVIDGPTPKDVVKRFTDLTGRLPMPPRWALGYQQSRYSYYPDSKVRFIADNFRQRQIPADVIWLDIHYQDGYAPFTWDKATFPDPGRLIADLRKQGIRLITIVDPHVKKEVGTAPYDSGIAGGHFVKNPDGSIYEGNVWPSRAEKNPGPSVFPDFSRPQTREWWGSLFKPFVDLGVAGIWNDMNEPAVFDTPGGTMPLEVTFDNDGQPSDQRELHNVYGLLMTRGTYEGLKRLRPTERPFVLTRATFAGGQRYAAQWPGDNVSDWTAMRGAIPTLLGMGLSGLSFVGVDVGGFAEVPPAELYTRWLQSGILYPFFRTHTAFGTADQEPWSYGTQWETYNRRAIELRYELLPHIYNVMHETSTSGLPAMRPLMLDYPDDPATYGMDDEYLFGSDLLLAPVLREGATDARLLPAEGHLGRRVDRPFVSRRAGPLDAGHARVDHALCARRQLHLPSARDSAYRRDAWPAAHRRSLCRRAGRIGVLRGRWPQLRIREGSTHGPDLRAGAGRGARSDHRVGTGWHVASSTATAAVRHPGYVHAHPGDRQRYERRPRGLSHRDGLVAGRSRVRRRDGARPVRADDSDPRVGQRRCASGSISAGQRSKRSCSTKEAQSRFASGGRRRKATTTARSRRSPTSSRPPIGSQAGPARSASGCPVRSLPLRAL